MIICSLLWHLICLFEWYSTNDLTKNKNKNEAPFFLGGGWLKAQNTCFYCMQGIQFSQKSMYFKSSKVLELVGELQEGRGQKEAEWKACYKYGNCVKRPLQRKSLLHFGIFLVVGLRFMDGTSQIKGKIALYRAHCIVPQYNIIFKFWHCLRQFISDFGIFLKKYFHIKNCEV